jgi:hypothetical protein
MVLGSPGFSASTLEERTDYLARGTRCGQERDILPRLSIAADYEAGAFEDIGGGQVGGCSGDFQVVVGLDVGARRTARPACYVYLT